MRTVPIFYGPAYVGSRFAFDTTRKAKWIAESLVDAPIPGVKLVGPNPLKEDRLKAVHDPRYVRAIKVGEPKRLAESQGFRWDPGIWRMVMASNGGVVDAALKALDVGVAGSLSSGLHHARYNRGFGFCTFNGLAIAANEALSSGCDSVLILDFDAHCGGGTASLIADWENLWQIDVSVIGIDSYIGTERISLDLIEDASEYLNVISLRLTEIDQRGLGFGLCIYNAGVDPFERCEVGGMGGITQQLLEERDRLVFEWCFSKRLPIAFVLAGGYVSSRLDRNGVVDLHRLTLSASAMFG